MLVHATRVFPELTVQKFLLKLFVAGQSPRASVAIANLKLICANELEGQFDLEIIDVLEHPQIAEDERILATPTLIKRLPLPHRRVIGDLSDTERVLAGLFVRSDDNQPNDDASTCE